MWLCLALFAAAGMIWLLDMVGVLTIRTSAQRTMLNASLGTTLLGGMASFAVEAFFTPPPGPPGQSTPTAAQSGPAPVPSSAGSPTPTPSAADSPAPSGSPTPPAPPPPPQAACQQAAHPPRLADWATAALGTPPSFRCAIAAPYPDCIADLRGRDLAEISRGAARACGDDLLAFRRTQISPAYAAKQSYQDNLDAAEASLRTPRSGEEEDHRDYVIAEIARMNGRAWQDFTALDQRSRGDMLACQADTQRCLIDQ